MSGQKSPSHPNSEGPNGSKLVLWWGRVKHIRI